MKRGKRDISDSLLGANWRRCTRANGGRHRTLRSRIWRRANETKHSFTMMLTLFKLELMLQVKTNTSA